MQQSNVGSYTGMTRELLQGARSPIPPSQRAFGREHPLVEADRTQRRYAAANRSSKFVLEV